MSHAYRCLGSTFVAKEEFGECPNQKDTGNDFSPDQPLLSLHLLLLTLLLDFQIFPIFASSLDIYEVHSVQFALLQQLTVI